jgi:hypothetical protein
VANTFNQFGKHWKYESKSRHIEKHGNEHEGDSVFAWLGRSH